MHLSFMVLTLIAIGTGLIMMVKIDTPLWIRDPYWLDSTTWGWIYVAHGIATLIFVSTVMLHIYFALRPEKLLYTRAMIWGWITREEYNEHHDSERWQISSESNSNKQ